LELAVCDGFTWQLFVPITYVAVCARLEVPVGGNLLLVIVGKHGKRAASFDAKVTRFGIFWQIGCTRALTIIRLPWLKRVRSLDTGDALDLASDISPLPHQVFDDTHLGAGWIGGCAVGLLQELALGALQSTSFVLSHLL